MLSYILSVATKGFPATFKCIAIEPFCPLFRAALGTSMRQDSGCHALNALTGGRGWVLREQGARSKDEEPSTSHNMPAPKTKFIDERCPYFFCVFYVVPQFFWFYFQGEEVAF